VSDGMYSKVNNYGICVSVDKTPHKILGPINFS
jgi:hypothetical protein